MATEKKSGGRGFAGMDPEKQREISRKGGEASHGGRSSMKGERSTTSTAQKKNK